MKSQGFTFGKDALYALVEHVQDAFLAFLLPVHARSERRRQANPRKVYVVDHGLARACAPPREDDLGHHLENLVYLELRRRGEVLGYHACASGHEVDFVFAAPDGSQHLVQVCAQLGEPATRERELEALGEAMRETRTTNAVIVTLAEEGTATVSGKRVRIVPAWRWTLEAD